MRVRLHPHAWARLEERGATEAEVRATVEEGERFAAKFWRTGFRRNFTYNSMWLGRFFATKQVETIAAEEEQECLVTTTSVRFF